MIGLFMARIGQAEEQKIVFLDAQKVLGDAKEGIRIRQTLDKFVKARQKVIDIDEQELKRLKDDLDKQGVLLSQEALRLKQDEIEKHWINIGKRCPSFKKRFRIKG